MSRIQLAALVAVVALGALAALAIASPHEGKSGSDGDAAHAGLSDADGKRVGRVSFYQVGERVFVEARVRGLTPGFHGFHVHATGVCEPPFTSAGGHWSAEGQVHGDHIGDLPVLQVNADGRGYLLAATDRFSVSDLMDMDGSAAIVHANPDNYANIPDRYTSGGEPGPDAETLTAGDSGPRVACGVVR